MSIDLLLFGRNFIKLTTVPTSTFDQNLIATLKSDTELYRLLPDFTVISQVRRDLDFGAAAIYNLQSTSDYNSMILFYYYHFIDLLNKNLNSSVAQYNVEIPPAYPYAPFVDFLNVKYILSDKSADGVSGGKEGEFTLISEGGKYRLFRNERFLPRFFLVGKVEIFSDSLSLDQELVSGRSDLANAVYFTREDLKGADISRFNLDCEGGPGQVDVLSYSTNTIKLRVNSVCNSFLSTSEVYYPGWKAKLDGKKVDLYRGNVAFRSMYIPKGEHEIEFYFRPDSFLAGGIVTLLSLSILLYLLKRSVTVN